MDAVTSALQNMASPGLWFVSGMVCSGLASAILAAQLVRVICRDPEQQKSIPDFQRERLRTLRRGNMLFRWFEPFVVELSQLRATAFVARFWQIQKRLDAAAFSLPWHPQELLAVWSIQGVLLGLALLIAGHSWLSPVTQFLLPGSLLFAYILYRKRSLDRLVSRRLQIVRRRLPYAVDLMALMMEAGASFQESLTALVAESRNHPLGEEFARVLQEIECGQTLATALQGMADRLRVEDLSEIVLAVQTAEELGSPLSHTFLELAERMRTKQSLWAEKRAGEAKANITFPGIIIMVACLVIVVAPFVLQALYEAPTF